MESIGGKDISADFAERLALAYAAYLTKRMKGRGSSPLNVSVGWDCRLSSPTLAAAVVRGLRKAGINALRLGICPTPFLVFSVFHHAVLDGGIMITGSDRPVGHNGFRLFIGKQELRSGALEEISRSLEAAGASMERAASGRVADLHMLPLYRRYVYQECLSVVPAPAGKQRKIIFDLGNGTAAGVFPQVLHPHFSGHGLGCGMDGRFPNRRPWALEETDLRLLSDTVRDQTACFGIALDADSGGIAIVDELGRLVPKARLKRLLSRTPPKKRPYYPYDDAIFSALRFCEIASTHDAPISLLFSNQ